MAQTVQTSSLTRANSAALDPAISLARRSSVAMESLLATVATAASIASRSIFHPSCPHSADPHFCLPTLTLLAKLIGRGLASRTRGRLQGTKPCIRRLFATQHSVGLHLQDRAMFASVLNRPGRMTENGRLSDAAPSQKSRLFAA